MKTVKSLKRMNTFKYKNGKITMTKLWAEKRYQIVHTIYCNISKNECKFIYSIYIEYIEYLLCVRHCSKHWRFNGNQNREDPCPHGACILLEEIYSLLIGNICRDVGRECWTGAQCWIG